MFLIRSARPSDLEGVYQVARHLDSFNLTARHDYLLRLIRDSRASFAGRIQETSRRRYLFVAEEAETGRVAGCSMILARHGTPELPHLSLRIETLVKRSRTLGRSFKQKTLRLQADRRGYTEIGGLAVLPEFRGPETGIGRLLSYARFTYIARHRNVFRPRLLVEYLARADIERGNKLWMYLGRNFTGLSYREACLLLARNREFVLSLFPRERIFQATLPYSALYSIGKMADGAYRSLRMLRPLGFRDLRQVDPLDGGPHYGARTDDVPLVRSTALMDYGGRTATSDEDPRVIALRQSADGSVRALLCHAVLRGQRAFLGREAAEGLRVRSGDRLSVTPLYKVRMRS
ncbi:MAG: Arginine N-succinyltransferase subunit alpha [Candidatus Omnitrophica bacterium]|nr:Arginine N-succinyltransferase subunit alpha [Candidatus Omnitrophota bacterium]